MTESGITKCMTGRKIMCRKISRGLCECPLEILLSLDYFCLKLEDDPLVMEDDKLNKLDLSIEMKTKVAWHVPRINIRYYVSFDSMRT